MHMKWNFGASEKTLKITDSNAWCSNRKGLPCAVVAASSQRRGTASGRMGRMVHPVMFLTCMAADRAYTGCTGTGVDRWLSDELQAPGLPGVEKRIGMADSFHCFDGSAQKVWDGGESNT